MIANAGFFNRLTGAVPHPVKVGGYREMAESLVNWPGSGSPQKEKRHGSAESLPHRYGLQRFRDLSKADDELQLLARRGRQSRTPPSNLPPS